MIWAIYQVWPLPAIPVLKPRLMETYFGYNLMCSAMRAPKSPPQDMLRGGGGGQGILTYRDEKRK